MENPKNFETIRDFGQQWKQFPNPIDEFHSSEEILRDTVQGLFELSEIAGKRVLEIGSGSGRVLEILRRFGPSKLVGVEPSDHALVLKERFASNPEVRIVRARGDEQLNEKFDACFLIGVLHHIPEPEPVLRNILNSLAGDGRLVVWVYGREGISQLGVYAIMGLRIVTTRVPDRLLQAFSSFLAACIRLYGHLAIRTGAANLPMKGYLSHVFLKCSVDKQVEIVFDQLNPQCARYYRKSELLKEMHAAGFTRIAMASRHGYSITAVATRVNSNTQRQ
jgi:SAM-dependent methyltransferase